MANQVLCSLLVLLLFANNSLPNAAPDKICGKWMSDEKNLIINVYRENSEFRAKIMWFDDKDDTKEMEDYLDKHNPDPALRSRKILGMNVVEKLVYVPKSNSWEDGIIYDAQHGRHWNSSAYIDSQGQLKVKGYWHFKFLGRTMTFKRI
ncbi:DUF2147 domain-containing protein [Mucilaginibacter litoreus]|uniref:DUF2147 domain-containing protein n=1 Tax=Mucilaginibacter litoreus TaxID=1048221 RepID=A0ABW3APW6_9SPHI